MNQDNRIIIEKGLDVGGSMSTIALNLARSSSPCTEYSYAAPSELTSHDGRPSNRTELKETLPALFRNEL